MRSVQLLLVALLLACSGATAAAPKTAEEIRACVAANTPEVTHVQVVQLTTTDRVGNERVTRAHVYGRRDENGLRRVLARFTEPPELVGSAFLFIERADATELVVRSPELDSVKQVTAREMMGSVAGTDFSYEDFEQMIAFDHPEQTRRLEDTTLRRRAVYVVETRPAPGDSSAYERVVTFVDKEKCVALRIELYQKGKGLRKTLMVNPSHLHRKGDLWIPQFLLMEDLVDYTTTVFMVDSTQQDVEETEEAFRREGLALAP